METEKQFTIASSPHCLAQKNVRSDMTMVIIALTPALLWGFYLFRLPAILLTLVCCIGTISGEMLIQYFRKRPLNSFMDNSALLTGILLAMVLPPQFPLPLAFLGAWFAIIIGKGLFGGLGYNIFNPALLGRAFLQISFPVLMTTWMVPVIYKVQGISSATPLALAKFENTLTETSKLLFGLHGGCIGETSAILLLLGGLFLIVMRVIDYRIPLSILGTVAAWALLLNTGVLFHFFSGGLLLGAFFMATDYVTSPLTPIGNIIFGIGIGTLIMIIRQFGGLPEAVMFSILVMNAFVPLLNRHTRPRTFGTTNRKSS